jgi:hypothetical protein
VVHKRVLGLLRFFLRVLLCCRCCTCCGVGRGFIYLEGHLNPSSILTTWNLDSKHLPEWSSALLAVVLQTVGRRFESHTRLLSCTFFALFVERKCNGICSKKCNKNYITIYSTLYGRRPLLILFLPLQGTSFCVLFSVCFADVGFVDVVGAKVTVCNGRGLAVVRVTVGVQSSGGVEVVWFEVIHVAFVASILGPVMLVPQDSSGVNHCPVVVHVADVWCDEVYPLNSTDVYTIIFWWHVVLEVGPVWDELTAEPMGTWRWTFWSRAPAEGT